MKKLNVFLVLLLVLSLLSGCQDMGHQSAPRIITFKSEAALQEFLGASTMSDAAFQEFMTQKAGSFGYSGLKSKDDANSFLQLTQNVGLPIVKNKDLVEKYILSYRPDQQMYDIKYTINGVTYGFQYMPFRGIHDRSKTEPIAEYILDGEKFPVYQGADGIIVGDVYANGYEILLYIRNFKDVNALDIAQFTWSADMKYMK